MQWHNPFRNIRLILVIVNSGSCFDTWYQFCQACRHTQDLPGSSCSALFERPVFRIALPISIHLMWLFSSRIVSPVACRNDVVYKILLASDFLNEPSLVCLLGVFPQPQLRNPRRNYLGVAARLSSKISSGRRSYRGEVSWKFNAVQGLFNHSWMNFAAGRELWLTYSRLEARKDTNKTLVWWRVLDDRLISIGNRQTSDLVWMLRIFTLTPRWITTGIRWPGRRDSKELADNRISVVRLKSLYDLRTSAAQNIFCRFGETRHSAFVFLRGPFYWTCKR